MRNSKKKWWLALIVVCCLAPATFADQNRYRQSDYNPYQNRYEGNATGDASSPRPVPEGGSAAIYLLGAGLTCLGAMLFRSKRTQTTQ